ncbi:MAG: hypothetical protein IK038_02540 [Bacteroidaceae bacterium]|nr:hypothetical protein [Bacteroidaceae bacterium]
MGDWRIGYYESFIPKIKARHKKMLGRDCNLDNPLRLTDKLEWLKVYDSTFLKTFCSDKITVREYARDILGVDISIPILGIYDNFDDIDFSVLPSDYVIKTNHGSHTNVIVRNGNIDIDAARVKFNNWMSRDWSWWGYEFHYIPIPRKIYIEPFMSCDGGRSLIDYKFWCFNGAPKFFTINGDNGHGGINYYNMDGSLMPVSNNAAPADKEACWEIPNTFELMREYSVRLSKPFKFVRVDFYEISGKCLLGELTFIPGAGYIQYTPDSADYSIGSLLTL